MHVPPPHDDTFHTSTYTTTTSSPGDKYDEHELRLLLEKDEANLDKLAVGCNRPLGFLLCALAVGLALALRFYPTDRRDDFIGCPLAMSAVVYTLLFGVSGVMLMVGIFIGCGVLGCVMCVYMCQCCTSVIESVALLECLCSQT
jgi:hypothetical protein